MDILCMILFWVIVLTGLLSVFPFSLARGVRSICLLLPLLALILYAVYEALMRLTLPTESVPIRVDVLLVWPAVSFSLLAGLIRIGIVLFSKRERTEDATMPMCSGSRRMLQLGLLVPAFVVVVILTYFVWK